MKKMILAFSMLLGIYTIQSCNSGTSSEDTVDSTKDVNDSMAKVSKDTTTMNTMTVDKDDADFAVEAANGGMTEIAASQLADKNAASQKVKDYAAMIIKDHSAANDKLKGFAAGKNIALPPALSDKSQNDVNDLAKKTGKDFDKAYMNMMVDDHNDAISLFKKEGDNGKDSDLKNFAMTTLPTLQQHLDKAKSIKDMMK
ncbi:MAG: DUF4142 domain-containing protein [Chitinophagaceae bacterium]